MKRIALAFLLPLILLGPCLEAKEQAVAKVFSGTIADGIALFLPAEISPGKIPPSLCLLHSPQVQASLPRDWKLQPRFSRDENKTRVTLAVPEGASLYGTGEVTGPLLRNGTSITLWNSDNF